MYLWTIFIPLPFLKRTINIFLPWKTRGKESGELPPDKTGVPGEVDRLVVHLFIILQLCTRSPAPLSGCLVAGTACRPARLSGHSPGISQEGGIPRGRLGIFFQSVATSGPLQRSARSGGWQPVVRSRRRSHGRHLQPGPGSEIRETVRSMVDRQHPPRTPKTSGAEAATDRS